MSRRMKIVWLCHFADHELKEFYNIKKGIEFAPWISETLKAFKNDADVAIHVIAPNIPLNRNHEFFLDGIEYHLFKYRSSFLPRKIFNYLALDYRTNFYFNRRRIKRIVSKIKPDLIHLHGAENPYYSYSILQFLRTYPVLVTIQGFIKDSQNKDSKLIKRRIKIESQIIKNARYFGVQAFFIIGEILQINKDAICLPHQYLRTRPYSYVEDVVDKKYDCVFFARVCINKGIEDLMQSISIIKKKKNSISLIVIGYAAKKYMRYLMGKCEILGIKENVTFSGYLPPKDLYKLVKQAKVSVLPTYYDVIPGTVIESMQLKIPVVAYEVGGLIDLNKDFPVLKLVQKGNIQELASSILDCLNGIEKLQPIIELAFEKSQGFYDESDIKDSIKKIYTRILS